MKKVLEYLKATPIFFYIQFALFFHVGAELHSTFLLSVLSVVTAVLILKAAQGAGSTSPSATDIANYIDEQIEKNEKMRDTYAEAQKAEIEDLKTKVNDLLEASNASTKSIELIITALKKGGRINNA